MNASRSFAVRKLQEFETLRRKIRNTTPAAPSKRKGLDYVGTLRQWWESMPPATRNREWQLETICAAAFTNPERKPSVWRVALALRALGFSPVRKWTVASRNRRTWKPPQD